MKRLFAVLIAFLLLASGCSDNQEAAPQAVASPSASPATAARGGFHSVPPLEAQKLIETRQNLYVLDVRTPQELVEGAIQGARLVPFWPVVRGELTLAKDTPILLVCAVGGRSYAAGQALMRQGYTEVYNLSGGMSAWKQAGLPVIYPGR